MTSNKQRPHVPSVPRGIGAHWLNSLTRRTLLFSERLVEFDRMRLSVESAQRHLHSFIEVLCQRFRFSKADRTRPYELVLIYVLLWLRRPMFSTAIIDFEYLLPFFEPSKVNAVVARVLMFKLPAANNF